MTPKEQYKQALSLARLRRRLYDQQMQSPMMCALLQPAIDHCSERQDAVPSKYHRAASITIYPIEDYHSLNHKINKRGKGHYRSQMIIRWLQSEVV